MTTSTRFREGLWRSAHISDARGTAHAHEFCQVGEGQSGVHDVLDDEDIFVLDRARQILRDLNDSARLRSVAIRADAQEVDAQGKVDGAHEIGREHEASFEHAHQDKPPRLVVARDLGAELAHPGGDSVGRNRRAEDGRRWRALRAENEVAAGSVPGRSLAWCES